MTTPTNPEIELLARAYALILSWPEPETADPCNYCEEAGSAAEGAPALDTTPPLLYPESEAVDDPIDVFGSAP